MSEDWIRKTKCLEEYFESPVGVHTPSYKRKAVEKTHTSHTVTRNSYVSTYSEPGPGVSESQINLTSIPVHVKIFPAPWVLDTEPHLPSLRRRAFSGIYSSVIHIRTRTSIVSPRKSVTPIGGVVTPSSWPLGLWLKHREESIYWTPLQSDPFNIFAKVGLDRWAPPTPSVYIYSTIYTFTFSGVTRKELTETWSGSQNWYRRWIINKQPEGDTPTSATHNTEDTDHDIPYMERPGREPMCPSLQTVQEVRIRCRF